MIFRYLDVNYDCYNGESIVITGFRQDITNANLMSTPKYRPEVFNFLETGSHRQPIQNNSQHTVGMAVYPALNSLIILSFFSAHAA